MSRNTIRNMNTVNIKLREKRQALIEALSDGQSSDFILAHARVFDNYFQEQYAGSIVGPKIKPTRNPWAIVALGGYGRQEQCLHSDIDLLFLFDKRVPKIAADLVEEILFPLWDLGIDVGHATRSLNDCIDEAEADLENLTAMLDARFICGMAPLFTQLETTLRGRLLAKRADRVVSELVAINRRRHKRFGDSANLLQPNLKEGHGGLRDYHTLLWIARVTKGVKTRRDLEYLGCLSHNEFRLLEDALRFIWRVRNDLHLLAGRKCDQLYFEYQEKLSHSTGFTAGNGQQPVERFLGKLHSKMAWLKYLGEMFLYEHDHNRSASRLSGAGKQPKHSGLVVQKEMLNFRSAKDIVADPHLLIRIFLESARSSRPLTPEARRLVMDFLHLVNTPFRRSPAVIEAFERILVTPSVRFNVLNEMLDTGILIKFLPEFKHIHNRILYNAYHIYPVDRHSLRVVRALKSFGTPEDTAECRLCANLYKETTAKKLLCWAALLHDVAKGHPAGGHHAEKGAVIAHDLLTRRGMPPKSVNTVSFLIREHLFLVHAALRRDIQDEETAIFCARHIKTLPRLKMLYLLSVADSVATGPKAWNGWTAALLQDLFLKTANMLEKGELASGQAERVLERKKAKVFSTASADTNHRDIEAIFGAMSPRYLHYIPAKAMLAHIDLYQTLGRQPYVWEIASAATKDTRTITICTHDRPGLFSKIAGVFTLNRIDILNAQIYTWRNNIALDIFEVTAPPDPIFEKDQWEKTGRDFELALADQLDLHPAIKKKLAVYQAERIPGDVNAPCVRIDNSTSSYFTIIEIFANDFPGLLFKVTDALFRCRLDIWVAKIATNVDQVVDIFYVRDLNGNKIDTPKTETTIKQALIRSLVSAGDSI